MLQKVGLTCVDSDDTRVLQIGLGGGSASAYLLAKCSEGTRITSVEKDPRVMSMAEKFFGFKADHGKNEVENLDATVAVLRHLEKGDHYDYILIDCFEGRGHIPESCRSKSFIRGVHGVLKGTGVAIHQVWASQYNELYHVYNDVFGHERLSVEPVDANQNFLIVAKAAA
jgi:spermidine synthase